MKVLKYLKALFSTLVCLWILFPCHEGFSDILMESGWENSGEATSGLCDDAGKGYDCPGAWTCLDADSYTSDDSCRQSPNDPPWNDFKLYGCTDVKAQSSVFHSGSYSLEVEWNNTQGAACEWHLERTDNSSTWLNAMHDEFYISHWIRFDSNWRFVGRWKGVKLHDNESIALCTGGGIWLSTKNGDSSYDYGVNYSDTSKGTHADNYISITAGSVTVSNYAGQSADNGNECCKNLSNIGMNHPKAYSHNQFGPADSGSNNKFYWPGTWCYENSQHVMIGLDQWYQIIYHYKVHETDGLIEVWVREGDSGTLKKIIKIDKNAWNGTAYETETFDTRCLAPNTSSLRVNNVQLYPYMNAGAAHQNQPGMKMYVDDFIVATTFDEVEQYGLNGSQVPLGAPPWLKVY